MADHRIEKLRQIYCGSKLNKGLALYKAMEIVLSEYEKERGQDVSWIKNGLDKDYQKKIAKEEKGLALGYLIYSLKKHGAPVKPAIKAVYVWRKPYDNKASEKTIEAAYTDIKKAIEAVDEAAIDKDAYISVLPLILNDHNDSFPKDREDIYSAYCKVKEEILILAEFFKGIGQVFSDK